AWIAGGTRPGLSSRAMPGSEPAFAGYRLPPELEQLRAQVRRIVQDEIVPLEQHLDPDAEDLLPADYERIAAKVKRDGLWAMAAPVEYGGGGLDTFAYCVLLEEMSQHRLGLYAPGAHVFGRYPPPVIYAGTREQIERYAVPTLKHGWKTFFAITEPTGGS